MVRQCPADMGGGEASEKISLTCVAVDVMSSYQAPNARSMSELDYLDLKQQLQLIERQVWPNQIREFAHRKTPFNREYAPPL